MAQKILAVASNGGHLIQLLRLFPAFSDMFVVLVSTSREAPVHKNINEYYRVTGRTEKGTEGLFTNQSQFLVSGASLVLIARF